MKKSFIYVAVLIVGALSFASCQKDTEGAGLELNNTKAATAATKDLTGKIVFNELYFNIVQPSYWEEYFTITNISSTETLDLTGLSFGITTDFANGNSITIYDNAKNAGKLYLSQIYTIPGQKLLAPNATLVIAHSAIDHITEHSGSVNLTGADYEIFIQPNDGSESMTTDQPLTPNLDVNLSHFQAFHWQTTGSSSLVMFKYDQATGVYPTLNQYIAANLESGLPHPTAPTGTVTLTGVKIPTAWILDGQSGMGGASPSASWKVLPNTIDASFMKTQLGLTDYNGWMWKRKTLSNGNLSNQKSSALDFTKHTSANSYL